MKNKSTMSLLGIMLVMIIGLIFVMKPNAVEVGGGTGKISGEIRILSNEVVRQHLEGKSGTIPSFSALVSYDNVEVSLLDENGNKVADMLSGNGMEKGRYEFSNIPDGNYFIEIASVNSRASEHEVVPSLDANGLMGSNGKVYQTQRRSEAITISNGTIVDGIDFLVVSKPYALILKTGIGKFEYKRNGEDGETDILNYYTGGVKTFLYSDRRYLSVGGVLATDRLNHTINALPKPILTQEEIDFGYSFAGWILDDEMLEKYTEYERYRNVPLTEEGILNIQAHGDIILKAAFSWPIHKITFATDSSKGLIESDDGSSAYATANVEGNTKKLTEIPTVVEKTGYRFLGWYKDMTTNIVPEENILNEIIKGDITYYAKYEVVEPEVSIRPIMFPVKAGDMSIGGRSVANSEITLTLPDGRELATSSDANGDWNFDLEDSLYAGQVVSARQTEAGKLISPFIDLTVIKADLVVVNDDRETTPNPIVGALKEGDVAVVGKGIPGAMIQVTFKNYGSATTLVAGDGTWSVPVIQGAEIAYGDNVFVVQTENGKLSSSSTDATAVRKEELQNGNNPVRPQDPEDPRPAINSGNGNNATPPTDGGNGNNATPPVNIENGNNAVPPVNAGGSNLTNTRGGGSSGGGSVTPRVISSSVTSTPAPQTNTTQESVATSEPQNLTPAADTPMANAEEPVAINQNTDSGNKRVTRVLKNTVPKTEDRNNMFLWLSTLFMSLGMGAIAIKKSR